MTGTPLSPTLSTDRKRGLSDIWATLLGIVVGLGILASVLVVFKQATFSTHVAAEQKAVMRVSAEVKATLGFTSSYGPDGLDITETVKAASMLPEEGFRGITITAHDQSFSVDVKTGSTKECARLATLDFGLDATLDASQCSSLILGVTFSQPPRLS